MASGTWTSVATTGVWNTTTNWLSSIVADGSGNTANFTSNITATTTIDTTTGANWSGTIGSIVFSDNGAAGSAWTLGAQATVTLAGGTPTITTTTAATFSGAIAGSSGFTKSGTSALTFTAPGSTLTGTMTLSAGDTIVNSTTGATTLGFNNASLTVALAAGATFTEYVGTSGAGLTATFNTVFTGAGLLGFTPGSTTLNTITLPAGSLGGLTGTTPASTTNGVSGLNFFMNQGRTQVTTNVSDLPYTLTMVNQNAADTTPVNGIINYQGAGGTYGNGSGVFTLLTLGSNATSVTNSVYQLNANHVGATPLVYNGAIVRYGTYSGGITKIVLGGTNTADNKITKGIYVDSRLTPTSTTWYMSLSKTGTGKWIVDDDGTHNTLWGTSSSFSITQGTFDAYNYALTDKSAAATATSTLGSAATLNLYDATINRPLSALSLGGALTANSVGGAGNTLTFSSVTLTATPTITLRWGMTLNIGSITQSGGTWGLTLTQPSGAGTSHSLTVTSTSSSTYAGPVSLLNGVTFIGHVRDFGSGTGASNLVFDGSSATPTAYVDGTLSRAYTVNSSLYIGANATGLTISSAPTFASANSATTFLFESNNSGLTITYSATLGDNGSGATTVYALSDTTFSSAGATDYSFTGGLNIYAATSFNGVARTLSSDITMAAGSLANGSANITPGGTVALSGASTVTAPLAGSSKTLNVTGGTVELAPANATKSNSITGTGTLSGGTTTLTAEVDVTTSGNGKVLGGLNTTVQSGAGIKTKTGTLQLGRARYGGNLTFAAGSTLTIGG